MPRPTFAIRNQLTEFPEFAKSREEAIEQKRTYFASAERCESCDGNMVWAACGKCMGCYSIDGDAFALIYANFKGLQKKFKQAKPKERKCKLDGSLLPEILEAVKSESYWHVGKRYGVADVTVRAFLKRNGVNLRTLERHPAFGKAGKSRKEKAEDVDIPAKVKACPPLKPAAAKSKERSKGRFGEFSFNAKELASECETYVDSATGKTVTKYPPGYAHYAHPQRNVHVKGGA